MQTCKQAEELFKQKTGHLEYSLRLSVFALGVLFFGKMLQKVFQPRGRDVSSLWFPPLRPEVILGNDCSRVAGIQSGRLATG
jgi:hypothetical protein